MSAGRSGAPPWALTVVVVLMPIMPGQAQTPGAAPATLQDCSAIADPSVRLSCYDRLAGRPAAAGAPSAGGAVRAVATPSSPAAAPATPPAAAPQASSESFGKYQAEHPQAPTVASQLEAQVLSVGTGSNGRMTVALQGGALWELDEADPLLVSGDTVIITRASLGSYLMHTPQKRLHRVRRLH
jgi:hypothetical protein